MYGWIATKLGGGLDWVAVSTLQQTDSDRTYCVICLQAPVWNIRLDPSNPPRTATKPNLNHTKHIYRPEEHTDATPTHTVWGVTIMSRVQSHVDDIVAHCRIGESDN